MTPLEFNIIHNEMNEYTLSDVAMALDMLAAGEASWYSSDDEAWNALLSEAADILRSMDHHNRRMKDNGTGE